MRHKQFMTWNMARNTEKRENWNWIVARKLKNVENETQNCMTWNMERKIEKT